MNLVHGRDAQNTLREYVCFLRLLARADAHGRDAQRMLYNCGRAAQDVLPKER